MFAVLLAVGTLPARAAGPGNVYIYGGAADTDDFSRLDTDNLAVELGVGFNYLGSGWDAHLEVNFFSSELDVNDPVLGKFTRKQSQLGFGVRKYWGQKRMHPNLGVGLSWLTFDNVTTRDGLISDATVGLWLDGGLDWDVGKGIQLGFVGRVSATTGIGVESTKHGGGYHLGGRLAWGWKR